MCAKNLPIQETFNKLAPLFGVGLVIFGGAMAFLGSRFLFQFFGATVGLTIAGLVFLIAYQFMSVEASVGVMAGAGVGSLVVGLGVSYVTYRFTKAFAVPILMSIAFSYAFMLVAKILTLKQSWQIAGVMGVGAVAGWLLSTKLQRFSKCGATAFIGAFMIMRGIGQYAGNFPSLTDVPDPKDVMKNPNHFTALFGYIGGIVVIAIAGTLFQMRKFP